MESLNGFEGRGKGQIQNGKVNVRQEVKKQVWKFKNLDGAREAPPNPERQRIAVEGHTG